MFCLSLLIVKYFFIFKTITIYFTLSFRSNRGILWKIISQGLTKNFHFFSFILFFLKKKVIDVHTKKGTEETMKEEAQYIDAMFYFDLQDHLDVSVAGKEYFYEILNLTLVRNSNWLSHAVCTSLWKMYTNIIMGVCTSFPS